MWKFMWKIETTSCFIVVIFLIRSTFNKINCIVKILHSRQTKGHKHTITISNTISRVVLISPSPYKGYHIKINNFRVIWNIYHKEQVVWAHNFGFNEQNTHPSVTLLYCFKLVTSKQYIDGKYFGNIFTLEAHGRYLCKSCLSIISPFGFQYQFCQFPTIYYYKIKYKLIIFPNV